MSRQFTWLRFVQASRAVCLGALVACCGCPDETSTAADPPVVKLEVQQADDETEAPAPEIDDQSKEVLDAFSAYIKGLAGFSLDEKVAVNMKAEGMKMQFDVTQVIRVARPNRVYLATEGGGMMAAAASTIVSDGKKLYRYMGVLKKYSEDDAPASLDDLQLTPMSGGPMGSEDPFTAALLGSDPLASLMKVITKAEYVGQEKVDDRESHHLKIVTSELDYDVWIAAGDQPIPVKIIPDMKAAFAKMAERVREARDDAREKAGVKDEGEEDGVAPELDSEIAEVFDKMEIEATVMLVNFKPNPEFGDDAFAFTAPEGAEKVDDLFGGLLDLAGGGDEPAPSALLGKPAPDFDLETFDGGQARLADLKGKVVMLDFWASWCGPCRQALPKVSELAERYKEKGLVFFAVNEAEDKETIAEALEEDELSIPVAMDTEGTVGEAYLANAIPQTVLVGPDGTVQAVHVGASPDLEAQLEEEIKALLDGKKLAEPPAEGEGTEAPADDEQQAVEDE